MYSRTSIYRHVKKPITAEPVDDNRHRNKGIPSKLSAKDKRSIFKEIPRFRESVGSSRRAKSGVKMRHFVMVDFNKGINIIKFKMLL